MARRQEERQEVEQAQHRLTELTELLATERQRMRVQLATDPLSAAPEPAENPAPADPG